MIVTGVRSILRVPLTRMCVIRRSASSKSEAESLELYSEAVEAVDISKIEEDIENKRNKSRLAPQHRRMLHGQVPYDEPMCETHKTLRYKRRMYGRYGAQSNVDPATLWPDENDLEEALEYERVLYPCSIEEMVKKAQGKVDMEAQAIEERQKKISENLKNLDKWKKDIADRVAKKNAVLAEAKARKEALIEDVRRHFGFKIDPRDERFKEVLLQKEKEQKKKMKELKSKAKQEKLLAMYSTSQGT